MNFLLFGPNTQSESAEYHESSVGNEMVAGVTNV